MNTPSSEKVWFITGCSRGIGRVLAEAALETGDKVVATARHPQSIEDLSVAFPGQVLCLQLDVCEAGRAKEVVEQANRHFGRIDVLVNNAGYGLQGTIEELSMCQIRAQMETNFFGLVELTQAVIPVMRAQADGWIVNVSSMAGLRGSPTFGAYNASKFAVEGMTEALAGELKPFGIRVTAVEPGPYRTDWAGSSLERSEAMVVVDSKSPYAALNHDLKKMLDDRSGKQPGDPKQIASVLLEASRVKDLPVHMVFGDIAVQAMKDRIPTLTQDSFFRYFPHDQYHY